ncbi:MAG: sensor histidine kinase [Desulfobacterales bacterium]
MPPDQRTPYYRRLFYRFVLLTMLCSLVPLLLVGWGLHIRHSRFAKEKMIEAFQAEIEHHRRLIELFLSEHAARLQLIARTHSMEHLTIPGRLGEVFEELNRKYWAITDLGVIDAKGRHLAYVGPYDLLDKNYIETFWFKEVMDKGLFISDMFLGFRKEPHFVIAVINDDGPEKWILRATIDTEVFRSLVEKVQIGKTGEVYLVNRDGILQTSPRFHGQIMDPGPFPVGGEHDDIQVRITERMFDGSRNLPRQVVCQVWLKEPRWKLVVRQDLAEAFSEFNRANRVMLIILHLSALSILVVAVLVTRHMITVIKRRDREADHLNRQLMQTGKLAAIGQLSAGVAHEINNPLAIVLTERQILLDSAEDDQLPPSPFRDQFIASMNQIHVQVQRCKRITQNLLRFSRRTQSIIQTLDINGFLSEIIDLMEREARASGIKFFSEFDGNLPLLMSDPSQLQQVFLNLITNAIDAHEGRPYGTIRLTTVYRSGEGAEGAEVIVADTGSGMPPEIIDRIFDPFFTTKPEGKGTGLGLSICFSTMRRLGGSISVESRQGEGTTFTLFIPLQPPRELLEEMSTIKANR